jgi:hypothetical protein
MVIAGIDADPANNDKISNGLKIIGKHCIHILPAALM